MFRQHVPSISRHIGRRRVVALALLAIIVAGRALAMPAAADINATVTADNAYSFGWGDGNGVGPGHGTGGAGVYVGPSISPGNSLLFKACPGGPGPNAYGVETYSIPAGQVLPGNYLYVVGYSDDDVRQGVLGTFRDTLSGVQVETGVGPWQVCATGDNYDGRELTEDIPDGVPSLTTINAGIRNCNVWTAAGGSGPATTSGGWVDQHNNFGLGEIYFGSFNDSSVPVAWGQISCIPATARWMWFNSSPSTITDPTDSGGNHKEFLIFRLPMESFQPPCPTVIEPTIECIPGALGPSGCYKVTVSVENTSTSPVDTVLVQGHGASPSVVTLNPPLAPGDARSISVTICPDQSVIASGTASLTFVFPGPFDCCRQDVRFGLPECPSELCVNIPTYRAECVPGDANAVDLWFEFDPPSGGGGFLHMGGGIEPDLVPLPLGDTNLVIGPLHIGNAPGPVHDITTGVTTRKWCTMFYVTPDGDAGTCCHKRVCFDLPTCGLPATPVASRPGSSPPPTTLEGTTPADGRSR